MRSPVMMVGIGMIVLSLVVLVGLGIYIATQGGVFGSGIVSDAMVFIDVPGRIAVDGKLQIEGPAPVPVSAGEHTLTFFDTGSKTPLNISLDKGEFLYIPNPDTPQFYSYSGSLKGKVVASAFPPDTIIKVPNCTLIDSKYPKICEDSHMMQEELSVGTYTIQYSNPNLGDYAEEIAIGANIAVRHTHSFITTLDQWNTWRKQHGEIIEQQYGRRYRRYGADSAILLPLEATGELFGELFD